MSPGANRREDEVRRLLDTPHPAVPIGLPTRAVLRGRRIVRRRRAALHTLWALLLAALLAGIVLAVLAWPAHHEPPDEPATGTWWSPVGMAPPAPLGPVHAPPGA